MIKKLGQMSIKNWTGGHPAANIMLNVHVLQSMFGRTPAQC